MKSVLHFLTVIVGIVLFSGVTLAATEPELKERFKARFAQLEQLKNQGKLGETFDGRVDTPKPEFAAQAEVQKVMTDENRDRAELYQLIGKRTGATPEQVAARSGARHFENAQPGEWLKYSDGSWKKK